MRTFNDPNEYNDFLKNNIDSVRAIAIEEHDKMAKDFKTANKSLTSGKISSKTLRELGHPFSRKKWNKLDPTIKRASRKRRQGVGHVPLLPINVQTGRLKKSLRMQKIKRHDALNVNQISFNTKYAKFVLGEKGTKRMIPRGFIQAIKKVFKKRERIMKQVFRYRVFNCADKK